MTALDRRSDDLLAVLRRGGDPSAVTHVERLPRQEGRTAPWPDWTPDLVRTALARKGIHAPWQHQADTAELAHGGRHVIVSTGTASGKSLGYQLPVLADLMADPTACALYFSPTKALAVDQLASIESLGLLGVRPALFDGDTPMEERDWVRSHARLILTNPDMLHRGVLPAHARWARVLRNLKYVVIDECHAYRGVFGSHVALVIRRLRRLARMYGADPVFLLASATVADPAVAARRLIGSDAAAVTVDSAPRSGADFVLWEPPVMVDVEGENGAPVRRSAPNEAARMMADLVSAGARTLTFVRSRHGAEQTAMTARRRLGDTDPDLVDRVAAYRGGYLPEERRELERALGSGALLGVATTNALELGVDIAGLDAALLAGYPGTLASVWQQAGRAGRGDQRALVVFVAREDPLDSYLVHHPEAVFGKPVEAPVIDPGNPHILGPHLACAAAEHRLTDDDLELFGESTTSVIADLVRQKVLRARPSGWFHHETRHPADQVDLRGSGGGQIAIVEEDSGRLLGTVDEARAPAAVHPGAVHLHRGQTYSVLDLDLESGVALVHLDRPEWTTIARSVSTVEITETQVTDTYPTGIRVGLGKVCVTEQVVGYLRRRPGGEMIDMIGLDMPEHTLHTRAVWYTIDHDTLCGAGLLDRDIPGSLHAAEHAAIGLLPLFAGCDRWDIGGLSTNLHPDTGEPTVIVYDGFPGGAGFADRGHAVLGQWLTAVREAVRLCPCAAGCPSCVQSPKCGNGNQPLDKAGAVVVLDLVVQAMAARTPVALTA
ncbi:DEAD/DEAH box helicase [Nakamurella panacisegetis]|uniref:DEAD/DEAH box helicase n=1 Tax=Nakamurella panacisegetis TaxID=1090615 RepID=UPI001E334B54|nr:DEAD/DEAH box helicase [Nakamurella panacisegetis]